MALQGCRLGQQVPAPCAKILTRARNDAHTARHRAPNCQQNSCAAQSRYCPVVLAIENNASQQNAAMCAMYRQRAVHDSSCLQRPAVKTCCRTKPALRAHGVSSWPSVNETTGRQHTTTYHKMSSPPLPATAEGQYVNLRVLLGRCSALYSATWLVIAWCA